jgi:hypothetical protein
MTISVDMPVDFPLRGPAQKFEWRQAFIRRWHG